MTSKRANAERTGRNVGPLRKAIDAIETLNRHDLNALRVQMRDDMAFIHPLAGATDRNGLYDYMASVIESFPDLTIRVKRTVCEGAVVAAECTVGGTFKKTFRGVPATDRFGETPVMFLFDIDAGKVQRWRVFYGIMDPIRGEDSTNESA